MGLDPKVNFNKVSPDDVNPPIAWSPKFLMLARLNGVKTDGDKHAILLVFAKLIAELELEGRTSNTELRRNIGRGLTRYLATIDPQSPS